MSFFKGLGEKLENGWEIAQNQGRQLLNKVQGVEATKDERFDAAKKVFDHHLETVEKMLQSVKMQDNGLQALGNGLSSMAKYINAFNGEDNKVPGAVDLTVACDILSASVDSYIEQTRQVEENLKLMVEQLSHVKKHIIERDRLLIDFDKARHDLASEMKKVEANPSNPPPTLAVVQKRHDERQEAYHHRNEEVLNEMNEIWRNRNIFTELQMYIAALAQFFSSASQQFSQLSAKFASLPPPRVMPTPTYAPAPGASAPVPAPAPTPTAPGAYAVYTPPPAQQPVAQPAQRGPAGPPPARPPPPNAKKARALYNFKGETPTELSFSANDTLLILNTDHPEWWLAELNGARGEVPATYVQLL